jgi:glutaredoxin-like protein NrdH
MMEVKVYTTPNCSQCMATKRHMDRLNIPYTEIPLQDNPDKIEEFVAQGHATAPIVTTDIKIWSGYRHSKIESLGQYLRLEGKQ